MDEYAGKLLAHLTRHADTWTSHLKRRMDFRVKEVSELADGHVHVVEVDPDTASTWQRRFVELRNCIEKKDTARACQLLSQR